MSQTFINACVLVGVDREHSPIKIIVAALCSAFGDKLLRPINSSPWLDYCNNTWLTSTWYQDALRLVSETEEVRVYDRFRIDHFHTVYHLFYLERTNHKTFSYTKVPTDITTHFSARVAMRWYWSEVSVFGRFVRSLCSSPELIFISGLDLDLDLCVLKRYDLKNYDKSLPRGQTAKGSYNCMQEINQYYSRRLNV